MKDNCRVVKYACHRCERKDQNSKLQGPACLSELISDAIVVQSVSQDCRVCLDGLNAPEDHLLPVCALLPSGLLPVGETGSLPSQQPVIQDWSLWQPLRCELDAAFLVVSWQHLYIEH